MVRNLDWTAPAKLFFWPAENGSEEEAIYDTLRDAVRAAREGDGGSAWIITESGSILNPRMIAVLVEEQAEERRRRRPTFNPFAWARAA